VRASTWIFLGLFGLFVLRHVEVPRLAIPAQVCCEPAPSPTLLTSSQSRRVRDLENELATLDQRGRDLDRSLQAVDRSARTLRELADRSRDDDVRQEYAEVAAGRQRLDDLHRHVEAKRVAVAARLQLARAGLDADGANAASDDDARRSPVDALSNADVERVTARAR
jgi:hypothetical protein